LGDGLARGEIGDAMWPLREGNEHACLGPRHFRRAVSEEEARQRRDALGQPERDLVQVARPPARHAHFHSLFILAIYRAERSAQTASKRDGRDLRAAAAWTALSQCGAWRRSPCGMFGCRRASRSRHWARAHGAWARS